MSKQEEIWKGIINTIESCWEVNWQQIHDNCSLDEEKTTDKIINSLHSQGVVIKVVTKLPLNPYSATSIPEENVGKWLGYHKALEDMAGYVAVEPLIKVGVAKQ